MWFVYAIGASIMWGLVYVANQSLLKHFDSLEMIYLESLLVVVVLSLWFALSGQFTPMISKLQDGKVSLLLCGCTAIYLIAAFCIFKSISMSNASLAAIVEACYPIFTMIFAYIILREVQFNLATLIGSGLIIAGLVVINI